ncbi:helix-turn-helix domain-containing protein [Alkalihalobacillus sp. 1P02AB]|uniref:helix-turn-helix domain-containing protein n=1 Tax=Alkalihalobacillus sp. 1P02AB TaxID=3132260 RepID=UPI0039A73599
MAKVVNSNLKNILDERNISIRSFTELSGLHYETVRRMYHNLSRQYQKETIGRMCEVLDIEIADLLILEDETKDHSAK